MYRLIFNVIEGESIIPESVQRLWGYGPIHFTFIHEPSDEKLEYVEEVLEPDWIHVGDPYQGVYENTNIDRHDLVFNLYSHEVMHTGENLLKDIKYVNVLLSYPVDIYYMYDEKHYYDAHPWDRVAEPRIYSILGDGRKRPYLPLRSGMFLAPDYVGDLNSYGVTVASLLNYSKMGIDNLPLKRWSHGGLIRADG